MTELALGTVTAATRERDGVVFVVNPASANGSTGRRWPEIARRAAAAGLEGDDAHLDPARARSPTLTEQAVAGRRRGSWSRSAGTAPSTRR